VAHAREPRHEPAPRLVRSGGAAGGRGDDDPGPLPVAARVVVYHADGCHLCARAIEVVREVQSDLGFELELVDVGGDPGLEARYREHLPVVEIDGQRAFTYFVDADALEARLSR
jgi:glutaredoxin